MKPKNSLPFLQERIDLAAAFRWAVRLDLHEAVANHFSFAVSDNGKRFLINPNQRHFSLIKASDLLLLDADDATTMQQTNAPDPTAWGLHGSIHRLCPHARCVLHVHSTYSTVLASLANSVMPPIDQNAAMFFNRHVVDSHYGGLAFDEEGLRCAGQLKDPKIKIMVMGNHGVLAVGPTIAETFNNLYYFERAAKNYILALQTGQQLRVLSDEVAEKTALELDAYPDYGIKHFNDLKEILDKTESDYRL